MSHDHLFSRAPLAVAAAAFAVGIGLAWGMEATLPAIGIFLGVSGFLFLAASRRKPEAGAHLALLGLIVGLGAFRAWVDQTPRSDSIASLLTSEPKPIGCEGLLASDLEWIRPAHGPARRQGWLEITRIRNGEEWISSSGRVLLKLHAHTVPLAYGDGVHLSGAIRGPRPGKQRFDEGHWLWLHGAWGILTVTGPEGVGRLSLERCRAPFQQWCLAPLVRYRRWVASFRWRLKELGRSLLGSREAAYLEAFLLGEGRGIPREVWDAFKKVGVIHVLVVSGLHVGLIASIILIGLSLIRIPRTARHLLLALGLATYCLLTGGNPPILRATIMGVLLCFGRAAGREVPALNSLGLAAVLILAMTPRALADASFQLSFAAVLGLFTLTPWFARWLKVDEGSEGTDPLEKMRPTPESETVLQRWRHTLWRWTAQGLAASCGAWLAISPVVAWHFQTFTPIALIANLIVIPWTSLLIAVGFVLYSVGLFNSGFAVPFAASFSWLVYGLDRWVTLLANLPGASWKWSV